MNRRVLGRVNNHNLIQGSYMCNLYNAADSDDDSLCDGEERFIGSYPNNADSDGDFISDTVEYVGGYRGVELIDYGVNPLRKTKLIELDYLNYHSDEPYISDYTKVAEEAITKVVEAFANAPVDNPDGSTGIDLFIDQDNVIDPMKYAFYQPRVTAYDPSYKVYEPYWYLHREQIGEDDWKQPVYNIYYPGDLDPRWTVFDRMKADHFNPAREKFFHYAISASRVYHVDEGVLEVVLGLSRGIPSSQFTISNSSSTNYEMSAMLLMHEFGHNLGLGHGGNDNVNFKANYFSIMNYNYGYLHGLSVEGVDKILDYSRLQIAGVSENNLNETSAFSPDPEGPNTERELAKYGVAYTKSQKPAASGWLSGNASSYLDFNRNGNRTDVGISADLNADGTSSTRHPASQNDWDNLYYGGSPDTLGDVFLGTKQRPTGYSVIPDLVEGCIPIKQSSEENKPTELEDALNPEM